MKKILLVTGILLTSFSSAQTTTYYPFPERNASWNFYHYSVTGGLSGDISENYSISFSGDTLINNQTYHTLTVHLKPAGYRAAIRQDIASKKVFIVPPTESSEQLLYDFSLHVGDTVKGYLQANLSHKDIVKSIDSVLVGTNYRKRWLINSNYNIYLLEGIGSTYGLLQQSPGNTPDQDGYSINCYRENSQTLYPDSHTNCELINSVSPIESNPTQIRVSPNNESGSFTITFDNAEIAEIKLIDLSGKMILVQPTINKKAIRINNLQPGLYILTGKCTTNKLITRKIISCP